MQRGRDSRVIAGGLATVIALALACGGSDDRKSSSPGSSASKPSAQSPAPPTQPPPEPEPEPVDLVAQGRSAFMANCTACHNMNPTQPGSIGPAIAGSSLELLEGKVLRNEYPPGYTPKRDTRAMIPLPHLEAQIPALYAYLSQAK